MIENKGIMFGKININIIARVIVENIIPRNMIINLGCAWIKNHIPREDIFDWFAPKTGFLALRFKCEIDTNVHASFQKICVSIFDLHVTCTWPTCYLSYFVNSSVYPNQLDEQYPQFFITVVHAKRKCL